MQRSNQCILMLWIATLNVVWCLLSEFCYNLKILDFETLTWNLDTKSLSVLGLVSFIKGILWITKQHCLIPIAMILKVSRFLIFRSCLRTVLLRPYDFSSFKIICISCSLWTISWIEKVVIRLFIVINLFHIYSIRSFDLRIAKILGYWWLYYCCCFWTILSRLIGLLDIKSLWMYIHVLV